MKKKKMNFTTVLLVIIFLAGLSLLLYPTVANAWNKYQASKQGEVYIEKVASLTDDEYKRMWQEATEYNQNLAQNSNRFNLSEEEIQQYMSVLNIDDLGMIGVITIPSIDTTIPIYHGTSESVLQKYSGHMEGTSLPIGGAGTHALISGHRGLPSAKLFTDIVNLEEGDYFMINVLEETLTYQVDQISIVEPTDYSKFNIEPDQDYVTLMTCTPYGVNSHRLLVRGHRVDNLPDDFLETRNEALIIDKRIVALFIAIPILLVLFVLLIINDRKKSVH